MRKCCGCYYRKYVGTELKKPGCCLVFSPSCGGAMLYKRYVLLCTAVHCCGFGAITHGLRATADCEKSVGKWKYLESSIRSASSLIFVVIFRRVDIAPFLPRSGAISDSQVPSYPYSVFLASNRNQRFQAYISFNRSFSVVKSRTLYDHLTYYNRIHLQTVLTRTFLLEY